MSKSITYNSITDVAINMLSSFNVAYYTASSIRKAHKEAIENAENALQEKLNERQVLINNGMSVNDAIAKISTLEEGRALELAKTEEINARKDINKLYSDGRSLVLNDTPFWEDYSTTTFSITHNLLF